MQVSKFLISTYRVHICINTISRTDVIVGKRHSFPFCKRVYHFGLLVPQVLDRERHGTLHSVQVVVYTHTLKNEQWGCYAAESEFR